MQNILSYQQAIFTGKEIKEWIQFHTFFSTSKTKIAKRMQKYLNINDDQLYRIQLKSPGTACCEWKNFPIVKRYH